MKQPVRPVPTQSREERMRAWIIRNCFPTQPTDDAQPTEPVQPDVQKAKKTA